MTQGPTSKRDEFLDFWQRRERWFMVAAPYVLLSLCVIVDAASRPGGLDRGFDLDLAGAMLAFLVMAVLDRHDARETWFGPTPIPFRFAAPAIATLAAVWLVNTTIASLFSWFGWIGTEQDQRRTEEVTSLTEANARLAESLATNEELQQRLVSRARESLSAARRSVAALAPEPLEGARLPEAVSSVAQRWSQLHGIPVAVITTGEVRATAADAEVALLRTAQEALANVAKHAHAGRVGLTLSYMEDLVTLDVRDDGVGFDAVHGTCPDRPAGVGGYGLSVMRERIESVSGSFAVESEPEVGTAISAAVPLGGAA
jgi:two-component sensor histidine kinase